MTDATQTWAPRTSGGAHSRPNQTRTGWVGWVYFAGFLAVLGGTFQLIIGLVALVDRHYYQVTPAHLVVHMNYTAWGWVHIAIAVLLLAVGLSLFVGSTWARVVGIGIAGLSAIANFSFVRAYPVWAILAIAIDVFVIYALAVHGREVEY